MTSNQNKI